MSLPELTEVLIVGAGPTGLACALSLHKQGCRDVLIVDAVEHGEDSSRAFAVHAATLEVLDSIGCAQPLVDAGSAQQGIKAWDGTQLVTLADFTSLKSQTKYPFVLTIPQTDTERILGEHVHAAGILVRRPFRAVGIQPDAHDANYTRVLFESGQTVRARYVIGADGSKSTIRQAAGIGYKDPHTNNESRGNLERMVLGDVTFQDQLDERFSGPVATLSPDNLFLTIPYPSRANGSQRMYRIVCGVPTSSPPPPSSPSKEYLQSLLAQYGMSDMVFPNRKPDQVVQLDKVVWSTRFRTHSAIADKFFTRLGGDGGVVLFIGDAAHIHPPAGGQGMNLGLRDAVSLGSALAAHIKATASSPTTISYKPLQEWADHRRELALKIIGLTKSILRVASLPDQYTWIAGVVPIPGQASYTSRLGTLASGEVGVDARPDSMATKRIRKRVGLYELKEDILFEYVCQSSVCDPV